MRSDSRDRSVGRGKRTVRIDCDRLPNTPLEAEDSGRDSSDADFQPGELGAVSGHDHISGTDGGLPRDPQVDLGRRDIQERRGHTTDGHGYAAEV